jgi:hypothetical protein
LRFLVLVAAAAGIGAVSVVALQTLLPQQRAAMDAALRSLSAEAARFRLADLNPIRWIYDDVTRQITSQDPATTLNFPSGAQIAVGAPIKLPAAPVIDQRNFGGAVGTGFNSPTQYWRPTLSHR